MYQLLTNRDWQSISANVDTLTTRCPSAFAPVIKSRLAEVLKSMTKDQLSRLQHWTAVFVISRVVDEDVLLANPNDPELSVVRQIMDHHLAYLLRYQPEPTILDEFLELKCLGQIEGGSVITGKELVRFENVWKKKPLDNRINTDCFDDNRSKRASSVLLI
jgi:hypothetical protein